MRRHVLSEWHFEKHTWRRAAFNGGKWSTPPNGHGDDSKKPADYPASSLRVIANPTPRSRHLSSRAPQHR